MKTTFATTRLAHAKLNLRLVVGPKSGPLHEVLTAIVTLALADELEFASATDGFSVRSPDVAIQERDNLVWRAAHELTTQPSDISVTIRKRIPVQAGLGGGSADAAQALLAFAEISSERGHPVSFETLNAAAARVGSDVPAALVPGLKIVRGGGERVTSYPASAPPWGIVLLKPAIGSDTAQAYVALDALGARAPLDDEQLERTRAACAAYAAHDLDRLLPLLHNDFCEPIEAALPLVAQARLRLEASGALATLLCGSGSCVAGLYADAQSAQHARDSLEVHNEEWCAVTSFHG